MTHSDEKPMCKSPFMTLVFACCASATFAGEPILCQGSNPDWKLGLSEKTADFTYKNQDHMDVPQSATALSRDWPRAFTLIGRANTAIVLLDRDDCVLDGTPYPISADILTQDGTLPVLLTGCCKDAG